MPIEIVDSTETNVVQVELSGKLETADYERLVPRLETAIERHGKLRLLVTMRDFHGWELGALWQDVKFDIRHAGDFERIAMVGDSKWQSGMATFCKPFTSASVEYFDEHEASAANKWLCSVGPAT